MGLSPLYQGGLGASGKRRLSANEKEQGQAFLLAWLPKIRGLAVSH